jgi:hypothetical protein
MCELWKYFFVHNFFAPRKTFWRGDYWNLLNMLETFRLLLGFFKDQVWEKSLTKCKKINFCKIFDTKCKQSKFSTFLIPII